MHTRKKILKCSLHVHTDWSDGSLTPLETVDLYGKAGFDVLAITDHVWPEEDQVLFNPVMSRIGGKLNRMVSRFAFNVYLHELRALEPYAEREYGMLLLPGLEITKNGWHRRAREAHIVAIDVKEYISADQSPYQVLKRIKQQDAVALAAHPSTNEWLWQNHEHVLHLVDVWEYKNGGNGGVKYYPHVKQRGLRYVACDDFHRPKQLERGITYLACPKTIAAVKSMLRHGVNLETGPAAASVPETSLQKAQGHVPTAAYLT